MTRGDNLDSLIRSTLRAQFRSEEPSAAARDSLLAAAACENTLRSAVGPVIPPLAAGLQENGEPEADFSDQVITVFPLARRHLLLLASPLYAVR